MIVLPLQAEQLWTILQNQANDFSNQLADVDCVNSYKNLSNNLILYISNTQLKCNLINCQQLNYQQKCDILDQYIKSNQIIMIPQLAKELLAIVSVIKNIDAYPDQQTLFTLEQRLQWIQQNSTIVEQIRCFLDSCLIYIARQTLSNPNVKDDLKTVYKLSEYNIFVNIVNLLLLPEIIDYWHCVDINHINYFQQEFEQPYFGGYHLAKFMSTDFNIIYGLTMLELHNLI